MRVKGRFLVFVAAVFGLANTFCGVKGDPLPPEKPPELGRGKPSYRRAVKEIPRLSLPPIEENDSKEDKQEKDRERQDEK